MPKQKSVFLIVRDEQLLFMALRWLFKDFVVVTGASLVAQLAGKESACNAGDPSSIPGSGRSPGEGIGYPLQYSWASLVAQSLKNLPAMQRPGLGISPGGGQSSILAWRMPMDREAW